MGAIFSFYKTLFKRKSPKACTNRAFSWPRFNRKVVKRRIYKFVIRYWFSLNISNIACLPLRCYLLLFNGRIKIARKRVVCTYNYAIRYRFWADSILSICLIWFSLYATALVLLKVSLCVLLVLSIYKFYIFLKVD